MSRGELEDACAAMLEGAGFGREFTLLPVTEGANNRVFRVELAGASLLLKSYFQHPDDPRDRLRTEFAFCAFAWRHGVRSLPRPLASDPARRLGLYEFVPGRRLAPGEVDGEAVGQALEFYRALNRHKDAPDASALPDGSEACFSIGDHLRCVRTRVDRLEQMEGTTTIDQDAFQFVRGDLRPAWDAVSARVRDEMEAHADTPLDAGDRCLSPSDFGYHNALRDDDGRIRFLDFEYAGWDDPAKLVCDFFCQPAVPVPLALLDGFAEAVVAPLADPARQKRRIEVLLPLYRVKWCCIVLNEFLPVGRERRRFASSAADQAARKAEQLRKARRALELLQLTGTR